MQNGKSLLLVCMYAPVGEIQCQTIRSQQTAVNKNGLGQQTWDDNTTERIFCGKTFLAWGLMGKRETRQHWCYIVSTTVEFFFQNSS